MKKNLKKIIAAAIIGSLSLGLMACGQKSATQDQGSAATDTKAQSALMQKIKKDGKITLGTSADYPPYEFHKSVNGKDEVVGFDIEIAKEVAKDLGVKLEIKDMKFDGLLAALDSGNIDFVMAGMSATEERKKNVDFSNVYYISKQSIVARAEDKDKFKSPSDLKGVELGVQKGAIQEQIAAKQFPDAKPKSLGKISDIMLALSSKKVDAAIVELPVANSYVNKNKGFAVTEIEVKAGQDGVAVAVKKGNQDVVTSINQTLDKLTKDKSIEKFVSDANEAVE